MSGPSGKGLWVGVAGESAFTEPFIDPEHRPNQLPTMLQHIRSTGDERSLVIVSAVVTEAYLDSLLKEIMPGYLSLAKHRDVTFSLKLGMLKAMRLIPSHVVDTADLIRRIRNEFAHNLDCSALNSLSSSLKTAMAHRVRELYGDQKPYSDSPQRMFEALTFFVLAGLAAYLPNFVILREKLSDGVLTDALKKECVERLNSRVKSITSKIPLRVIDKEGWRYKYYENGVVQVGPVDPNNAPATLNLDVGMDRVK
jgi:hypothetical protein